MTIQATPPLRPRPASGLGGGGYGATERRLVTVAFAALAVGLAWLASLGGPMPLVVVAAAGYLLLLTVLGQERTLTLTMLGAFGTAPMYKGLAPSPADPITPTDILFAVAVMLAVPLLLKRLPALPFAYTAGVFICFVMGTLSTVFSPAPLASAVQFVQWLVVMVGLVGLVALWSPTWRVVCALLWAYVIGQMISVVVGVLTNTPPDGRYYGLSHHPNAFGEAGVMGIAALLYLWGRSAELWYRAAVVVAGSLCLYSVILSGTRAGLVVVAVLVVMIPVIERSAVGGFLIALGGALVLFLLPFIIGSSGEGSAISRLAGTDSAAGANNAREQAQQTGIDLFLQHPVTGSGFADVIKVHNIVLEIAVATGIVGLVGYLLVLYSLARPILGDHPERRIAYIAWAFIGITPTVPAVEDRTLWVPLALTVLLAMKLPSDRAVPGAGAGAEPTTSAPGASPSVPTAATSSADPSAPSV